MRGFGGNTKEASRKGTKTTDFLSGLGKECLCATCWSDENAGSSLLPDRYFLRLAAARPVVFTMGFALEVAEALVLAGGPGDKI